MSSPTKLTKKRRDKAVEELETLDKIQRKSWKKLLTVPEGWGWEIADFFFHNLIKCRYNDIEMGWRRRKWRRDLRIWRSMKLRNEWKKLSRVFIIIFQRLKPSPSPPKERTLSDYRGFAAALLSSNDDDESFSPILSCCCPRLSILSIEVFKVCRKILRLLKSLHKHTLQSSINRGTYFWDFSGKSLLGETFSFSRLLDFTGWKLIRFIFFPSHRDERSNGNVNLLFLWRVGGPHSSETWHFLLDSVLQFENNLWATSVI